MVQIVWCRPGDKPLSEPMMVRLPTPICISRPQWVNSFHDMPSQIFVISLQALPSSVYKHWFRLCPCAKLKPMMTQRMASDFRTDFIYQRKLHLKYYQMGNKLIQYWCLRIVAISYHQISNISCTKYQKSNVSNFVLQLSLCNVLDSGVKSRMKM